MFIDGFHQPIVKLHLINSAQRLSEKQFTLWKLNALNYLTTVKIGATKCTFVCRVHETMSIDWKIMDMVSNIFDNFFFMVREAEIGPSLI